MEAIEKGASVEEAPFSYLPYTKQAFCPSNIEFYKLRIFLISFPVFPAILDDMDLLFTERIQGRP